ncbi:MAG: HlyD family type I secretion periplasmic adaptor subunit [Magnetococcales bacterium]|nr:HlyD family type I secretion periplasmic adaptor subunit [Magnetococcales bacterium]
MLKPFSARHLTKSILLEESGNPVLTRLVAIFGLSIILLFVVWANFARIDEVAVALGKVVPLGHVQVVQHLAGGTIAEILVKDGDRVDEGQTLLRLDTFVNRSELAETETRRRALVAQLERLRAFLDGREMLTAVDQLSANEGRILAEAIASRDRDRALYEEQITQRREELKELAIKERTLSRQRIAIAEEKVMREKLHEKGYGSKVNALALERQMADIEGELAQIPAKRNRIMAQIEEVRRQVERSDGTVREKAVADLAKAEEELPKTIEQISRLEEKIRTADIRAPAAGIVHGLTVHTVGGVVAPSASILEIVPARRNMMAEVHIQPKDVGQVHPGQDVMVRFIAYDFSRYGGVPGRLEDISATSFDEANNVTYYKGIVSLERDHVGDDASRKVLVGMNVQADIRAGEKTVLDYLLKPIRASSQQALRER